MKRIASLAIVMAVLLGGTACGGRDLTDEQRLLRIIAANEHQARKFLYRERTSTDNWEIEGITEDDLRWQSIWRVDEKDAAEAVVSDDTLAFRAIEPELIGLGDVPVGGSFVVLGALLGGRWLLDYEGAPPLLASKTAAGGIAVGINPMLDAVYIFQYIRAAIADSQGALLFNPDQLINLELYQNDPFSPPDEEEGIKRYDLIPPDLPRRSAEGSQEALPTTRHFRKMAFYVKGQQLVRVEEYIEVEGHIDFQRARDGDGPKFPLKLLEAIQEGKGREEIRERRMSYELSEIGEEHRVSLPSDVVNALFGHLFTRNAGLNPEDVPQAAEE